MTIRKALFETKLLSTQVFVNCHLSKDVKNAALA